MTADGRNSSAGAITEHRNAQGFNRHLLASLLFGRRLGGIRSWSFHRCFLFMLLHRLDEAKTQLCKSVVKQALFFLRAIAASLLLQHRQQIYIVTRDAKIRLGPVLFLAEIQQPEMILGLSLQRDDQELESGGWEGRLWLSPCIYIFSFFWVGGVSLLVRWLFG